MRYNSLVIQDPLRKGYIGSLRFSIRKTSDKMSPFCLTFFLQSEQVSRLGTFCDNIHYRYVLAICIYIIRDSGYLRGGE